MKLSSEQVGDFFRNTRVSIAGNPRLRKPQQEGHATAVAHFAADGGRAMEQIPVGCGKTGLITLLPFGCADGRVLVIAPNLTILRHLVDAFDITNPRCFYRTAGVLTDLGRGPFVAELDADANHHDMDEAHIVVTNIQQLAAGGGRWLSRLPDDYFDLIIVDEGHHNAAPTWKDVFDRFPDAKVISLTATPFRADDQPVEGEKIYGYPIAEAMRQGFIKHIQACNVAPSELVFNYRGSERTHTLEEVLRLKEHSWFSRGVALAEACNISIVDASIEWLKHLREGGTRHQIVAAACSVDHARAIRRLYEERGWTAREIHSNMPEEQQKRIKKKLSEGGLDVIVQVQMLGEGFDHPPLSVAAVFRPYRSLSPYIQFVGRAMRVIRQNAPGHPDNRGVIVSHVGLNLDQHWEDFKQIDEQDQQLVRQWLAGATQPIPRPRDDSDRPPLLPELIVQSEITLDRFLGDKFLEIPDDDIPGRVLDVLKAQGIDPAAAGLDEEILRALRDTRPATEPTGPVAQLVQPQARRQAQQRRLNEMCRAIAIRICRATGLSPGGRKLAAKGGTGAATDLLAVIMMMARAVDVHLGIPPGTRPNLSIDELETAMQDLETIADTVQAEILRKVS